MNWANTVAWSMLFWLYHCICMFYMCSGVYYRPFHSWRTCVELWCPLNSWMASPMAQTVKRLPAMWETRVRFLGQEDPLEKEMAIHSSTLAWKIPWTEKPDRLQSMGSQRVRHNWTTSVSLSVQFSPSVLSNSLWPHKLQHARPPCPSPTSEVHSNSRPLSRWCHPAISSSVIPLSSCLQSLPASESFPMSQLFAWGGQSTGVSNNLGQVKKKIKSKVW